MKPVFKLIYSSLAYLNRKSGNYELALDYYKKALGINTAHHYDEWCVGNLTNILNLPLPKVQDSASVYIKRLENMLPNTRPDLQAKAYNNIGVYYEDIQQKEQAMTYYQKAIRTSTSVPYRAYSNLARIYDEQGHTARADSLYKRHSKPRFGVPKQESTNPYPNVISIRKTIQKLLSL